MKTAVSAPLQQEMLVEEWGVYLVYQSSHLVFLLSSVLPWGCLCCGTLWPRLTEKQLCWAESDPEGRWATASYDGWMLSKLPPASPLEGCGSRGWRAGCSALGIKKAWVLSGQMVWINAQDS